MSLLSIGNIYSELSTIDSVINKEYIEKGKEFYNKSILTYEGDIYATLGICHLLNIEGKGEKNKLSVKRLYAKTKNDELAIQSIVEESKIYNIPNKVHNAPLQPPLYKEYDNFGDKTDIYYHYLNNKAVIEFYKGKMNDSRVLFKSIIDYIPTYNIGIFNYGTTLLYIDPFETVKYLSMLIQKECKNIYYLCNRGISYIFTNQYDKAIVDFSQAIELDNNNPFLYTNRGSVYKSMKEYENAINDFSYSIKILPTNPINYIMRGKCYEAINNIKYAMNDYTTASYIDKDIIIK